MNGAVLGLSEAEINDRRRQASPHPPQVVNNIKLSNRKTVYSFSVSYLCPLKMRLNRLLINGKYEKKLWMYPRSTYSINGLRTKERRQCGNSTPRKDGQGRVPVGNQKGLFGHCRSCRLCETGRPRERTDHQPAGGRRPAGQKRTTDCGYRPARPGLTVCSRQIGLRNRRCPSGT